MNVGDKIRKIREIKGLKQDYLAARLGISATAYGNLERNETNITLERLEEIAGIFEMRPEDILAFDEKVVFNNTAANHGNQGYNVGPNHYHFPEEMKKLYEENAKLYNENAKLQSDMIKLLQEKVAYLEGKK